MPPDGSTVSAQPPDAAHDTPPRANPPSAAEQRSGKFIVVAFVTFAAGMTLYFALGMPGMDHGADSTMNGMNMNYETSHRLVDPADFESALADPDAVIINVHIPYDGEIRGTDLFMAFDDINTTVLPNDRATPLLVYCRTGNMSTIAVDRLVTLGFTDIVELDGGMNAWQTSGRTLGEVS